MCEFWRDISIDPRYAVSNLGRIKHKERSAVGKDGRKLYYKESIRKISVDRRGYQRVTLLGRSRLVHKLVAEAFVKGKKPNFVVDHIDGRPSNCKASNLRWVSQRTNLLNRYKVNAISGFVGVHRIYNSTINPWVACGKLNGKNIHLGCFPTKEEAARARFEWEKSVGARTFRNTTGDPYDKSI